MSEAWDWLGAPFDLRLGLALDRNSSFTDVVGLSASAAYPYGSSVNPANGDFLRAPPSEFKIAATVTGIYVPFETGAYTTAGAGSLSFRFDDAGTAMGVSSNSGSHDAHSTQGDNYRLDSQDFTIRYGQLVMPALAVGGEFKVTESSLTFEPGGFQEFPATTSAWADSSLRARTGSSRSWAERDGPMRRPADAWPFPPISADRRRSASARSRGRSTCEPAWAGAPRRSSARTSTGNTTGYGTTRTPSRWGARSPARALALRVGGSVDTVGKTTASAGVGFYGAKHVLFEVAYVYNAFPEIRQEFGVAHLVSSSIVMSY